MDKTLKIEETITKIIDWEIENNERIIDFFMCKNVDDGAWAYWLLSRGYVNMLIIL